MTQDAPERLGWADVLTDLLAGHDLQPLQAEWAMEQVMGGSASPGQIGAFLIALRAKGAAPAEIATFVESMLRHAHPVAGGGAAVDTCGTGGDAAGTVNLSSMAAIVVASTGQPVVKHGNRAASSKSGSADLLEELGIPLTLPPDAVEDCLAQVGITFCFAPVFHPAMKFAGPVRRELGIPTVFNILGPLANPARPAAQLVGVAERSLGPVVAQALKLRGTSALVVRGDDGLDEITTATTTTVWDATGSEVVETTLDTKDLGVPRPAPGSLLGGDAAFNAEVARKMLANDASVSAVIDAVCANAAAALVASSAVGAGSLGDRWAAGYEQARAAVADGSAAQTLQRWQAVARSLA
jgi:anthranilate phosphoribosyltransferase